LIGGDVTCDTAHPCDETTLTVNVSAATSAGQRIKVTVSWPLSTTDADYDLYILQGSDSIAQSATAFDPEIATIPAQNGTYALRIVESDPEGRPSAARSSPDPPRPPPPAATGPAARFQVHQAPGGLGTTAGEPSIGIDWATGVVATQSDVHTLFTAFDDCSS